MLFQILSRGFLFVQWQSLAELLFHLSGTKIEFFLFNQKENLLLVIDLLLICFQNIRISFFIIIFAPK